MTSWHTLHICQISDFSAESRCSTDTLCGRFGGSHKQTLWWVQNSVEKSVTQMRCPQRRRSLFSQSHHLEGDQPAPLKFVPLSAAHLFEDKLSCNCPFWNELDRTQVTPKTQWCIIVSSFFLFKPIVHTRISDQVAEMNPGIPYISPLTSNYIHPNLQPLNHINWNQSM